MRYEGINLELFKACQKITPAMNVFKAELADPSEAQWVPLSPLLRKAE